MTRPAVLAIDGGGTKLDAALLRRDGSLLGTARVRAATYDVPGDTRFLDQMAVAIEAACQSAGLDSSISPIADVGVYCLAGDDLPVDHRRIVRGLALRGWAGHDIVCNDTLAVLRAGTERSWGVGMVCGFGRNCVGVAPDGRVHRFAAVKPVSGDWGGAADLGEAALWHALRAQDGRGPSSSLRTRVPVHFGCRTPRAVMEAMYVGRIDPMRLHELAPLVFNAASEGDGVARALVNRQADEIVLMVSVAIRRLGMRRLDPDVVLGGGIFRTVDQSFHSRIRLGIIEVCPEARLAVLKVPPLVGAARLGLEHLGVARAAHRRIRDALRDRIVTASEYASP